MKLDDLRHLNKNDILEALGLEARQTTGRWLAGNLAVFGVGLLIGASAALMFAPKSGRDLRDDMTAKIRDMRRSNKQGTIVENPALT